MATHNIGHNGLEITESCTESGYGVRVRLPSGKVLMVYDDYVNENTREVIEQGCILVYRNQTDWHDDRRIGQAINLPD